MHTVELLPDPALDDVVRGVRRRLAAAGVPSLAGHPHGTNRPHLTLAPAPGPPPPDGVPTGLPVPVRPAGVLALPGRRSALAWAVVPTRELLGGPADGRGRRGAAAAR